MESTPPTRQLEQSRQHKILDWLAQHGLRYNPFATSYSETDDLLDQYYVEHSAFRDNRTTQSALIFARSGAGKTATRRRLETYFADSLPTRRVFAFSFLPSAPFVSPMLGRDLYLPAILAAAADALVRLYCQHAPFRLSLPPRLEGVQLAEFLDVYYPTSDWRSRHRAVFDLLPPVTEVSMLDETEAWSRLCTILDAVGVQKIVVMVDGFDEKAGDSAEAAARMAELALPLAQAATSQVYGANTAFKLFLPLSTWGAVTTNPGVLLPTYTINWGHQELAELLRLRLVAASGGLVEKLQQLADEDVADLDQFLIAEAGQSPRRLIHLVNLLFETFVQDFTNKSKSCRIPRIVVRKFNESISNSASVL